MTISKLQAALLVVVCLVAGFVAGRMTVERETSLLQERVTDALQGVYETNNTESIKTDAPSTNSASAAENTTNVVPSLTPEQKKMIESFGIDAEGIAITQEMIQCAEKKLGSDRIAEIVAGDTPSFLESTQLLSCYTN